MKPKDDLLGLRPIGRVQNAPQPVRRSDLVASASGRVDAGAHELGRTQRHAALVAGEPAAAARSEPIDWSQRQIHHGASFCLPTLLCSFFVLYPRICFGKAAPNNASEEFSLTD
jgi:hypothetical protein